jgi:hypothetical protein
MRAFVPAKGEALYGKVVTLTGGVALAIDPTEAIFYTVGSVHHALDRIPSGKMTGSQRLAPPVELIEEYANHFFTPRTLAEHIFHMYGPARASEANTMLEAVIEANTAEYIARVASVQAAQAVAA